MPGVTPTTILVAPFAMHCHLTMPVDGVNGAVAFGKAVAAPENGLSTNVPPPALAVVVIVITPVGAAIAILATFFVAAGEGKPLL